jgi:hypothetical protein
MNVAYRRSDILALDQSVLRRGFWETTVHPLLLEKGLDRRLNKTRNPHGVQVSAGSSSNVLRLVNIPDRMSKGLQRDQSDFIACGFWCACAIG